MSNKQSYPLAGGERMQGGVLPGSPDYGILLNDRPRKSEPELPFPGRAGIELPPVHQDFLRALPGALRDARAFGDEKDKIIFPSVVSHALYTRVLLGRSLAQDLIMRDIDWSDKRFDPYVNYMIGSQIAVMGDNFIGAVTYVYRVSRAYQLSKINLDAGTPFPGFPEEPIGKI